MSVLGLFQKHKSLTRFEMIGRCFMTLLFVVWFCGMFYFFVVEPTEDRMRTDPNVLVVDRSRHNLPLLLKIFLSIAVVFAVVFLVANRYGMLTRDFLTLLMVVTLIVLCVEGFFFGYVARVV